MYIPKTNRQRDQNRYFNSLLGVYEQEPSTKELIKRIKAIPNLKVKALACVLYLTGSRKNEIVGQFKPCQIRESKREDKLVFVHFINLPVQKKGGDMYHHLRSIPVLKEYYVEYLNLIYGYIRSAEIEESELLFAEGGRWCHKMMDKYLGVSPHRLRHYRATNLGREEGYNEAMLKRFFNWSNATSVSRYQHYNSRDLENQSAQTIGQ